MQSLRAQCMSTADEKVGFGTFGAAGKVRWLDAEVFDIRWLGERTFASTTDEAETQRKLSGNPIIGMISCLQRVSRV
jgi:hypothetical protein